MLQLKKRAGMNNNYSRPSVLKKTRAILTEMIASVDDMKSKTEYKKRWCTTVKEGQEVIVDGPCSLIVKKIGSKNIELVFFVDERVMIEKVIDCNKL